MNQTLQLEKIRLGNRYGAYLAFFGFVLLLIGVFLGYISTGMAQQSSFDSPVLSDSAVTLFVGCFVAVIGGAFLLVGLLSATRRPRNRYYY